MIEYTLTRKANMRNIVIRIKEQQVFVSASPNIPLDSIDKFVQSKINWIKKHLNAPVVAKEKLKYFDTNLCLHKFNQIAKDIYPLVANKLKFQPKIYVKDYKSRWGVCYHNRGYIILNKQLFNKPTLAIEQVILHEFVHFIIPNHGKKFHKIMEQLMPDYKERKLLLKQ